MKLLNLKEEIKEILEELENMYEISELEEQVNNINKIRDYIINLQQENKQLQEQLLVAQTNEEIFRLEMEDITKILGLDENTLFDDVKAYARSLKDNMFEKEQLNSLVNSCQEEIRRLKKQVEEYENELEKADSITQSCIFNGKKESEISYRKCLNMLEKHKNQQKEFISYLENKIYSIEPKGTGINYNCEYDSEEDYISAMKEQSKLNTLKEILSKYKSIIGDDK